MNRPSTFVLFAFWLSAYLRHNAHFCFSLLGGSAFSFGRRGPSVRRQARCTPPRASSNGNDETDNGAGFQSSPIMGKTSLLSHVMFKVPSVDDSVAYWTDKGGTVRASRSNGKTNGEARLLSAFVEMGCTRDIKGSTGKNCDGETNGTKSEQVAPATSPACFALELVRTGNENFSVGNVISYVGVSMLLQFQNNLLAAVTGDEKPKEQGEEPNGIPVCSAASAPGDYFARFGLKTNDLTSTSTFYTTVLGMDAKAQDDKMVCLRYDNDCFQNGVATTLVFDATTENLELGDCFDHIAITTTSQIAGLYEQFEKAGCRFFMKPTTMFGKQVCGLIDPNGYKVVVAGE